MEDKAGGELQAILIVDAVQVLCPGMRILQFGDAVRNGIVKFHVETAAGLDGEAACLPMFGVQGIDLVSRGRL